MDSIFSEKIKSAILELNKVKSKVLLLFLFFIFIFSYHLFLSAPDNFPNQFIFKIDQGSNLRNVSAELKKAHIIRSRLAFEIFVIMYGAEFRINYSDYLFESKMPVFEVARRISKGEHHIVPVGVTIPEGFNLTQISDTFASKLPNFNKARFLLESKNMEGYLFPDTYFFLYTQDDHDVLVFMSNNFKKKIKTILPEIISHGKTEKDIIIMASIIEREAEGDSDRGLISGILWKRINMGMPLQVDSASETYKNKGLPKSPIGNPGLKAIKVALYPEESPYLFYLHDKSGHIHYAKTFSEHEKNIKKYLK